MLRGQRVIETIASRLTTLTASVSANGYTARALGARMLVLLSQRSSLEPALREVEVNGRVSAPTVSVPSSTEESEGRRGLKSCDW